MDIADETAARIARRDSLEARLSEVYKDALHKLRVYVDTLDEERRIALHKIINQAEVTGNYHTVCYMLYGVEKDVLALRKELKYLIRQVESNGEDVGELATYQRQKFRKPKMKGEIR